jgi:hypothetical protein
MGKDKGYRIDLEADALPPGTQFPVSKSPKGKRRTKGLFVGGPFPWPQFCVAVRLPGKALGVWQLVHHQARMTRRAEITLPAWILDQCSLSRQALYRALADLQRVGLIQTDRRRGRGNSIRITLVELPEEEEPNG